MAVKKSRKKIIVLIVVVLLLGGGVAAYYGVSTGFFAQQLKLSGSDKELSTGTAYKESFRKSADKVNDLIAAGDKESIKQAEEIIDAEVSAANESGNDAYIVDAYVAKSSLLTQTGRPQESIDTILPSLEEPYIDSNEVYKNSMYLQLGLAYLELGDEAKAQEYLSQLTGIGGD
jgi:hypothetical protein